MAGVNAMRRVSVRVGQMLKEDVVIVVKKDRLPYPPRTRAVVLNVSVLEKPRNANSRLWYPLIVLQGNHRLVLHHLGPEYERSSPSTGIHQIRLHESEWIQADNPQFPVTRAILMVALQKVQYILIRASEGADVKLVRLTDVTLDVAKAIAPSPNTAIGVEQCRCPPQYTAASCQDPNEGYYRKRKPNYLDSKDILDLVNIATYVLKAITAIRLEEYPVGRVLVLQSPIHSVTRVNSEELMIMFALTVEKAILENIVNFVQTAIGVIHWVLEVFVFPVIAGLLLDDIEFLQVLVEEANLTDVANLPWTRLLHLTNRLTKITNNMNEYQYLISQGHQILANFTISFDFETLADILYLKSRELSNRAPVIAKEAESVKDQAQALLDIFNDLWELIIDIVNQLRKHGVDSHDPIGHISDRILQEAERILRELQARDFRPRVEEADRELRKARNLLDRVRQLLTDRKHTGPLKERLDRLAALLRDILSIVQQKVQPPTQTALRLVQESRPIQRFVLEAIQNSSSHADIANRKN
ncbi:unnamed protein product [Sphagnum jensenii]|uniref:Laminin IV type A domain-containing protein n=1 Tax=Sphagnum jensenii TaxID=128206 RepID=A0ABP0VDQ7_9BRYO